LAKFINVIMRRGKKSLAENIVYGALNEAGKRLHKDKDKHHGHHGKKDESGEDEGGRSSGGFGGKLKPGSSKEGLDILDKALNNVRPTVEVKSRRVGGATYQVPIEVATDRGIALAMRWVVKAAKDRSEKTMVLRLAAEIMDAHEGRGTAVKIRDDMHRMAKANQAFAHYRW
jgi:small subunit ribosomal protein S7